VATPVGSTPVRISVTLAAPVLIILVSLFLSPLSFGQSLALVQHASQDAGTANSATLAFASNNSAGNWIAVAVRASSTGQVFTVADSRANTYRKAVQLNETVDGTSLAIYYAEKIAGGANTVSVSDSISGTLRVAIFEYAGVATANSLDVSGSAHGSNASPSSGNVATTASGDLLLSAFTIGDPKTFAPGSGYTIRENVPVAPNTKLMVEDQVQAVAGTASASATLGATDNWGVVIAAFRAGGAAGSTPPNVTSVNPTSGLVGSSVTITGTNFGATQGNSKVTLNGISAPITAWSSTSISTQVPSGATSGPVVVTVGGLASNGVNFTVLSSGSGTSTLALVQHASKDAGTSSSTTLAFASSNAGGNWIAVAVRAGSTGEAFTVSDSRANTYRKAVQLNETVDGTSLAIYYAENIAGGANTVSVSDNISGTLRLAIFEYSGVATANSLDISGSAHGSGGSPSSGNVTTTASGDLLLGAFTTGDPETFTAGGGYTLKESVPAAPSTKLMVEDQVQGAAGTASVNATLGGTDNWGVVVAAFRTSGSGAPPPPISVSVSPGSATVSTGGGTQNFTATVQNDAQNQGVTWSLSGTGCTGTVCGTLSTVTTTSVTYVAPASVPNPAAVTLTGTSRANSSKSASATITVTQGTQGTLTITVSPKRAAITVFQTQQLVATITSDPNNAGATWSVDGVNGGNATNGTVSSGGVFKPGTQPGVHLVTATSVTDGSKSATSTIAVTDLAAVSTYHNNLARDGTNTHEYALSPSAVSSTTFGKLFSCPVDGAVYAQPLWIPNLAIGGGNHNVVFVATQHDSVYAFDAEGGSGGTCTQYWKVSLLNGGTPVNPADTAETGDISGEIGITGTPVIDTSTQTLYVVSKTKEGSAYHQRLHALSLLSGAEKFSGPADITPAITVAGTADTGDSSVGCTSGPNTVPFCPLRENQRPGLVLNNGLVYVAWASHGDVGPYHGWIMGFTASNLAQAPLVFNDTPNGIEGGIWMSGAAPAVDSSNNLYVITGNGDWDGASNFGDSILKLASDLTLTDWFTPSDQANLQAQDLDLGSGGAVVVIDLPSSPIPHILVGGGKQGSGQPGELFVLNRDNLGRFNGNDTGVVEKFPAGGPLFSMPAFWQNSLYVAGYGDSLRSFALNPSTSHFNTVSSSQSRTSYDYPGATPSVSSSGASNGIVWAIDTSQSGMSDNNPSQTASPAVLHGYDATNLATELWNSSMGTGNTAGNAVKFTVPTIANGRVYIGTRGNDNTQGSGPVKGQIDVYGVLPN
jgi:hypothetical protein